ncbi:MAG TPA: tryptophan 2,3-dioxygenase family protein [Thermoanaerobaculia bacterium]|nr:tryptophan 2,3-dioxygenase family protein [Thermoanaerobaculia bacterium]
MSLTYTSYLRLEELLACQRPKSEGPEHDEMLFIVIHQVYELWFKELLHELDYLRARLDADDLPTVNATLKRILTVLKVQVAQIDILETMSPVSFLSFRSRLEAASGFQSPQFRELEFVLGARDAGMLRHHEATPAQERLARRLEEASLWDCAVGFLARGAGFVVPASLRDRDRALPNPATEELHPRLIEIYRSRPDLSQLCERLVDLDEGLQEWRYRHVKMVERTIGTKTGTGGSAGAEYLRKTLFRPLFPDLWAIRAEL